MTAWREWSGPNLTHGQIARLLQERSPEFAALESLDNGKPIRESRDVDAPLAAAHLFHHAGWADKLEHGAAAPEIRGCWGSAKQGRSGTWPGSRSRVDYEPR